MKKSKTEFGKLPIWFRRIVLEAANDGRLSKRVKDEGTRGWRLLISLKAEIPWFNKICDHIGRCENKLVLEPYVCEGEDVEDICAEFADLLSLDYLIGGKQDWNQDTLRLEFWPIAVQLPASMKRFCR